MYLLYNTSYKQLNISCENFQLTGQCPFPLADISYSKNRK